MYCNLLKELRKKENGYSNSSKSFIETIARRLRQRGFTVDCAFTELNHCLPPIPHIPKAMGIKRLDGDYSK